MKKHILVIAICLVIPCFGYAQGISTLSDELQEALDKARTELGVIGVSSAVITPDEGLWLGVSGVSDRNPPKNIQPDMLFTIGSITKNFTATLILQLAEEGILDLGDTVGDWLPDLPERSARHIDDNITIRQLLNHTSGLHNFLAKENRMWYIATRWLTPFKIWEPEDTLRFVKRPYSTPGEGVYYSSTNYILLGMIIEKATNSTVAVEFSNRFFDPLGLESTFLEMMEPFSGELAHGHIDFLGFNIDIANWPREAVVSSGWTSASILSTAEDLAIWAKALFGGSILSANYLEQMLDFIDTGEDIWYFEKVGLGTWAYEHPEFGEIWYHDGQYRGCASFMGYLRDYDTVLVLLFNEAQPDALAVINALLEVAIN
jgi:D-alanyl-D-alanine carboxypeptidase